MIHILPHSHFAGKLPEDLQDIGGDLRLPHPFQYFCSSGRAALDALLGYLNLGPSDEVLITNSSGQTYVSSCVTCTVFNHCKPSRILSSQTRAILVIHEYGVPHPHLENFAETAERMGIPLIEDCAHCIDVLCGGKQVGNWGHYALYSLSKLFPVARGGILASHDRLVGIEIDRSENAKRDFDHFAPYLAGFSRRRRENFSFLKSLFPNRPYLFEQGASTSPFFFGVYLEQATRIRQMSGLVEWGATLEKDLLLVPTNPLVRQSELQEAMLTVKQNARL